VKHAVETKKLRGENRDLKKQLQPKSAIVGESVPMKALRQQIALMAPTNGRVLIYGESGSGKELAALAIHAESLRKDSMFVEVNCAAIPEDLIESELFGHRKGSFPGALNDKEGKFHKADGGTLFLDEVGDMSLKTQSKVLRTLDEQRFTPVGSDEHLTVDVRVIAATNKDLEDEISKGNFREDLFYRLNVMPFYVPPRREPRFHHAAPGARRLRTRLHFEEVRREPRKHLPHRGGAGAGTLASIPEDEDAWNSCQGITEVVPSEAERRRRRVEGSAFSPR